MPDKLDGVEPALAAKVRRVLAAMDALGFPMVVTEGYRSADRQREIYAQGRTTPGQIVTWTLKSKHVEGRAVDCAFVLSDGTISWADHLPWSAFGACAEAVGLRWGGRFFKGAGDRPHVELRSEEGGTIA